MKSVLPLLIAISLFTNGCVTGAALFQAGVLGNDDRHDVENHEIKPQWLLLVPATVPVDIALAPFELWFITCWHDP